MRTAAALLLLVACGSEDLDHASYQSVRDRVAAGPTRFVLSSSGNAGFVTARRWSGSGWIEGQTAIAITTGELVVEAGVNDALAMTALDVAFWPIAIPEDVFGKPAALESVNLRLAASAIGDTNWTSDDETSAAFRLVFDLDGQLVIDASRTPLGTQHLLPVPVELALTGTGDHVDAMLGLSARGQLWDWAGLLQLTGLDLSVSAQSDG